MSERVRTHYADDDTIRYMTELGEEHVRLRAEEARLREALRELYEATHAFLNLADDPKRFEAPADRLQHALARAYRALGER